MKQISLTISRQRVKSMIWMDSSALYATLVELITRTCLVVPRLELKSLVEIASKTLFMKQMFSRSISHLQAPLLLMLSIDKVLSSIKRGESKPCVCSQAMILRLKLRICLQEKMNSNSSNTKFHVTMKSQTSMKL